MSAGRQEFGLRPRRLPRLRFLAFAAPVRRAAERIGVWLERRRTRRHLTRLSDYMLKDIGISRADVDHEAEKPFWRK